MLMILKNSMTDHTESSMNLKLIGLSPYEQEMKFIKFSRITDNTYKNINIKMGIVILKEKKRRGEEYH